MDHLKASLGGCSNTCLALSFTPVTTALSTPSVSTHESLSAELEYTSTELIVASCSSSLVDVRGLRPELEVDPLGV